MNDLDPKGLLAGLEALTPGWAGAMVAAFSARKRRFSDFGNDGAEQNADLASAKWLADNLPAIRRHLSATVPAGDGEPVAHINAQGGVLMTEVGMEWFKSIRAKTAPVGSPAAPLYASRLSQGTGVTVKALEWKPAFWNRSDPDYEHIVEIWEAFGAGHIQGWVEQQKDAKFYTEGEQFDTLDAAKTSVQAKHERIIRSALSGDTL